MYVRNLLKPALLLAAAVMLVACSSAGAAPDSVASYGGGSYDSEAVAVEEIAAAPMADDGGYRSAPAPTAASRHAVGSTESAQGQREPQQAELPDLGAEETPTRAQSLIYTAAIILAIYDVANIQDEVVALVEEMDGYISQRTQAKITARVPADEFQTALAEISELGDVIDTSWEAQDVTDQMRDLDIRLRNALELRNRLEELLDQAESVSDALQIEAELERITLEIERIRGSLQSFEDRIAYSTIEVSFRVKRDNDVPQEDFLLPFSWLNTLGLQSLLRAPGVYR